MKRSGWLALMILLLSAALLQAQRAGGGFSGGARMQVGNGFRTGPQNGFFPGHNGFHHNDGFGAVWLPWYSPYWGYWDGSFAWDFPVWDYVNFPPSDNALLGPSYQQSANTTSPQVIVVEREDRRSPAPPPEPPKLIEVPLSKDAPVAKPLPATLFVLRDGERLESHHYMITVESLQISVGGQQRTIPISALDLDATIARNHERGIEVIIPQDRSTVFIGS